MPDPQLLSYIFAGTTGLFALIALAQLIRHAARASLQSQSIIELGTRLEQSAKELERTQEQLDSTLDELAHVRDSYNTLREADARLEERSRGALRSAQEKIELLQSAREQMTAEFNVLANRIFEEIAGPAC